MKRMQFSVPVEQDGPAEAPLVTMDQADGTLIINTTARTLQTAPSVNGPWENVAAPLQIKLDELRPAEFFRAINP